MHEISEIKTYPHESLLKGPFRTAKGSKTSSPSVIIELKLKNGICGFGSATPVKYVTGEDVTSVLTALEKCIPIINGLDICRYLQVFETLKRTIPEDFTARSALEIAVLDAFCKLYNLPMCNFFGGHGSRIETDITIPIVSPERAKALVSEAVSAGFNSLKLKIEGKDIDEDFARVAAICESAPSCSLRLDANQSLTPESVVTFVKRCLEAEIKIDMLEQPVPADDIEGLRYVTKNTPVPIFADESAVTPSDVLKLLKHDAVDGINVKLMKCGISGAMDIISMCKAAGKELMLGCMIETAVSMSAAVSLACGTGAFSRIDLDAHLLMNSGNDIIEPGYTSTGAELVVDKGKPGHGSIRL